MKINDADHTDAALRAHASIHDCPIVLSLLGQVRRVRHSSRNVDVQLRDSNVQSQIGETLQVLLKSTGNLPQGEMALETNSIYRYSVCDKRLDHAVQSIRFGVYPFSSVVIDATGVIRDKISL